MSKKTLRLVILAIACIVLCLLYWACGLSFVQALVAIVATFLLAIAWILHEIVAKRLLKDFQENGWLAFIGAGLFLAVSTLILFGSAWLFAVSGVLPFLTISQVVGLSATIFFFFFGQEFSRWLGGEMDRE